MKLSLRMYCIATTKIGFVCAFIYMITHSCVFMVYDSKLC